MRRRQAARRRRLSIVAQRSRVAAVAPPHPTLTGGGGQQRLSLSFGGPPTPLDAAAADVTVMFSLMAENEYDWKPLIVTQAPRAETGTREPQT